MASTTTAAATKKTVPAKKAAPVKKTAPAKKAAPAKKTAAPAKKAAAPAKKAAAKKAAPAKKTAPAKKVATKKATAPAKKTTPAKKVAAKKVATKKTTAPAKKTTPRTSTTTRRRTSAAAAPTITVQNTASAPEPRTADERWRRHPVAANVIRGVALLVPLACSIVSGVVLSQIFHRPQHVGAAVAWWLGIMAASTGVLVAVDRVARRALPLATLLKLTMAFPDQAPSRFSVAARAGTTRSLQDQLRRAQEDGIDDGPAQAAHRILTLVGALGAHDRRTRGHSERVRAFNDLIAEEMRLPQHDRDRLRWAALLHDIGKLHVPTRILNKPKKPTDKEWAILKSHPERGARIAAPLTTWLGEWAPTIEQHHERWDGAGYPHGISGNDLCLGARIVAVADAYEVMTAPRPYSRPVSAAAAREELARCAGAQFDPEVVRAFLNISIGKLRKVIGPISWLAQLPLIGATPRLEAAVGMAGRQVVTVAATATGTGVLAAAMLPQAAHMHHHHDLTAALSAGTVHTHTTSTPSRPVTHEAATATRSHSAPTPPRAVAHVTHAKPQAASSAPVSSAPPTGSTSVPSSQAKSTQVTHSARSQPTKLQPQPTQTAPTPPPAPAAQPSTPPPTNQNPAAAPPPKDPQPTPPPPKDDKTPPPPPDPAPTPPPPPPKDDHGKGDPKPANGDDGDKGHH